MVNVCSVELTSVDFICILRIKGQGFAEMKTEIYWKCCLKKPYFSVMSTIAAKPTRSDVFAYHFYWMYKPHINI